MQQGFIQFYINRGTGRHIEKSRGNSEKNVKESQRPGG